MVIYTGTTRNCFQNEGKRTSNESKRRKVLMTFHHSYTYKLQTTLNDERSSTKTISQYYWSQRFGDEITTVKHANNRSLYLISHFGV